MKRRECLYSLAEEYALGFLNKGREGWDVPHTRAVFYYAKKITGFCGQDMLVIPTAAWLHDIGYFGLFNGDSGDYQTVQDKKKRHMEVGAKLAYKFISRKDISGLISSDQGNRIVHLVSVHDKLEELVESDEIILAEADALGAIDVRRVKPSFDAAGRVKYLEEFHRRMEPIFTTELGKKLLGELLPRFENYRG
jgi:putative nucleotidyltransferase with HDIG domain